MAQTNWTLIWADEFEGPAGTPVDPAHWTHEIGGHGWGNNEHQYYTDRTANASLDGESHLAMIARLAEGEVLPGWHGNCGYTSARLISYQKFEVQYGRIEARLQVPHGQGIWPAFWMLGSNISAVGWPECGEIDIMEKVGFEPYTVHGTVHGPGYFGVGGISGKTTLSTPIADQFHVYAVEWEPKAIRWYVDNTPYHSVTPDDLKGNPWVFDHPFFILMNVAVGGFWPGYPDDTTQFPQTMLVDYVRVYQANIT